MSHKHYTATKIQSGRIVSGHGPFSVAIPGEKRDTGSSPGPPRERGNTTSRSAVKSFQARTTSTAWMETIATDGNSFVVLAA